MNKPFFFNIGGVNTRRKIQKVIMHVGIVNGVGKLCNLVYLIFIYRILTYFINFCEKQDTLVRVRTVSQWTLTQESHRISVLNLVALEHAHPLHSFQGIVILQVLHEVAFGQNYVSTAHDQRQVAETFVNEVLSRNAARAIQGLGPLVYNRCKEIWEDV